MAEGWQWARTQEEECPECGFDAAATPDRDLAAAIVEQGRRWSEWLNTVADHPDGAAGLRTRRAPDQWSALEYACHVRDVLSIFTNRVMRMQRDDRPELDWWDHEAAVTEDRYADALVQAVAADIAHNAADLARVLQRFGTHAWDREGVRRGELFTIRGVGRFVLHELHHHFDDAFDLVLPTTP